MIFSKENKQSQQNNELRTKIIVDLTDFEIQSSRAVDFPSSKKK